MRRTTSANIATQATADLWQRVCPKLPPLIAPAERLELSGDRLYIPFYLHHGRSDEVQLSLDGKYRVATAEDCFQVPCGHYIVHVFDTIDTAKGAALAAKANGRPRAVSPASRALLAWAARLWL